MRWAEIATSQEFVDLSDEDKTLVAQQFEKEYGPINAEQAQEEDTRKGPGFTGSIARGIDETQATLYGAAAMAGKLVGSDKLKAYGIEGYQRNMEEAQENAPSVRLKEIDSIGDVGTYIVETAGSLVPSMAMAAIGATTGAGLGAVVGKAALKKSLNKLIKDQVKGTIGDVAKAQLKNKVLAKTLTTLGGQIGMGAAVFPMEAGGNYAEALVERGIDNPLTAILTGAAATALEYIGGNSKLIKQIFGKETNQIIQKAVLKKDFGAVARIAKEMVKNAPQEAAQEAGQEFLSVLNIVANTGEVAELGSPESIERYLESAVAGAIGGGAGGIVSGMAKNAQAPETGPGETGGPAQVTDFDTEEIAQGETEEVEPAEEVAGGAVQIVPAEALNAGIDGFEYSRMQKEAVEAGLAKNRAQIAAHERQIQIRAGLEQKQAEAIQAAEANALKEKQVDAANRSAQETHKTQQLIDRLSTPANTMQVVSDILNKAQQDQSKSPLLDALASAHEAIGVGEDNIKGMKKILYRLREANIHAKSQRQRIVASAMDNLLSDHIEGIQAEQAAEKLTAERKKEIKAQEKYKVGEKNVATVERAKPKQITPISPEVQTGKVERELWEREKLEKERTEADALKKALSRDRSEELQKELEEKRAKTLSKQEQLKKQQQDKIYKDFTRYKDSESAKRAIRKHENTTPESHMPFQLMDGGWVVKEKEIEEHGKRKYKKGEVSQWDAFKEFYPEGHHETIRKGVAQAKAFLKNKAGINVHHDYTALPKRMQRLIEAEQGESAPAFYDDATGEIHLFSSNIADKEQARKAVLHELGHRSFKDLLGPDKMRPILQEVLEKHGDQIERQISSYAMTEGAKAKMRKDLGAMEQEAEEWLMNRFETGETGTLIDRFKNILTKFFRKLGWKKGLTDSEIRVLFSEMRKNLKKGRVGPASEAISDSISLKRAAEGQKGTTLGNALRWDVFEIMKKAGGAKNVKSFLETKTKWKGMTLTPEGITYISNRAKSLQKNPAAHIEEFQINKVRNQIALGTLKEGTDAYGDALEKHGSEIQGHTIQHRRRFFVSKKKIYGPTLAGDKKEIVTKQHPLLGTIRYEQYRDKAGNIVMNTPIFSKDPKKRIKQIDAIIKKNKGNTGWYDEWNGFMTSFTEKGIPHEKLVKFIKIQAILSAGTGPQGNMKLFKKAANLLEVGEEIIPGAVEDGGSGISGKDLKKIMEIWEGRDSYNTLEERRARYGDKVGTYMTTGLLPHHKGGITIDRHMPRLWGYDITWSPNGKHSNFTVAPGVEAEIVTDIQAAAVRNGITSAGVQAALWYESRIPDVEASTYQEAAQIQASEYLPNVLYETTLHEDKTIIHYSDAARVFIRGSKLEEAAQSYSRGDVAARKENSTSENPYVPYSYFYGPGVEPEPGMSTKVAHTVSTKGLRIYDAIRDPLGFRKTAYARQAKDPGWTHIDNIFAGLVKRSKYDGFVIRQSTGEWYALFPEVAAEPQVTATMRLSDVVEGIVDMPQNITELNKLAKQNTPALLREIEQGLESRYKEIRVDKSWGTLARFGQDGEGATSGKMEYGLTIELTGPLASVRSAMSEFVGIGKSQRMLFMEHDPALKSDKPGAEGKRLRFEVEKDFSKEQIQEAIDKLGIKDYNIAQSGFTYIDMFLGDWETQETVDNFKKLYTQIGSPGSMEYVDSFSETLGDLDGDLTKATENYKQNIIDFFGKTEGEKVYDEAIKRGAAYTSKARGTGSLVPLGPDAQGSGSKESSTPRDSEGDDSAQPTGEEGPDGRVKWKRRTKPDPKKTITGYKLVRLKKSKTGQIFPLFLGSTKPLETGVWLDAEIESKGGFAPRPGFHLGDKPVATHIGGKGPGAKNTNPVTVREPDTVWVEVEVAADVDWQKEANSRADRYKTGPNKGQIIPKTAEIRDTLPEDGFYRYKTNPNMTGEWIIGGAIKINKILSDAEVKAINDRVGFADLPRNEQVDLKRFGFGKDHPLVSKPKLKFSRSKQTVSDFEMSLADRAIYQGVDNLHPLAVAEKRVKTTPEMSGYKSKRLLTSFPIIFHQILHHGRAIYADKWVKVDKTDTTMGLFQTIRHHLGTSGEEIDLFFQRMQGKSAAEMQGRGIENIFGGKLDDTAEIKRLADTTQGAYEANRAKWDALEADLKEFNKSILKFAEQAGLINPEQRKEWFRDYYIPFTRMMESFDTADVETMFQSTGGKNIKEVIKKMRGGHNDVGDPLNNLIYTYAAIMHESLRNLAHRKALTTFKAGGWAERLPHWQHGKSAPGVVKVFEEGRAKHWKIHDPYLFDAVNDMTQSDTSLHKVLTLPKRWLTYSVTFAPAFRVANFLRDTVHSSFMDKSFVPFLDSWRGLVGAWTESPEFVEYASTGGAFGGAYYERDLGKKDIGKAIEQYKLEIQGKSGAKWKSITGYNLWQRIGEASENAARLGRYMKGKKKGQSSFEAGFDSKDLLDFHMSGKAKIMNQITSLVPFLNARMQGLYKLGKTATDKRNLLSFYGRGAALAIAACALHALNEDDERYQQLKDHERYNYFHFYDVPGLGHVRMPLPFEVGAIFGTLPAALVNSDDSFWRAAKFHLINTFHVSPVDIQILKPYIQQAANKDFFTGVPIEGIGDERLDPEQRFGLSTTKTAKWIGEQTGLSPKRLDQFNRDVNGYIGTTVFTLLDQVIAWSGHYPDDPAGITEQRYLDALGVRRFVRGKDDVPVNTKSTEQFYEALVDFDRAYNTHQNLKKFREYGAAGEYRAENKGKLDGRKVTTKTQQKLSKINSKIKLIHRSRKLTPEQKREQIDRLLRRRQDIILTAMRRVTRYTDG